ncbi:barstar family protein [Streptomyces lancefieldiae]|uniref:Barstar family protein n=1 Tax=Streptomyces lancefieldiae TaxID=3075520 RepID=A0ABU3B159_9ACTN|nr:barstar family protein [Streptomyces sp. DSM 40712]MDT0616179.1 barstar family protein [Streptomyces sp. DSM 40712]
MQSTRFENSMDILYRLVDNESGNVLLAAEDIRGFFVEPGQEQPERFTFVRVHLIDRLRRKTEEAVLQVVDRRGRAIGDYYLGRVVTVSREVPVVSGDEYPDVEFSGYTWEYPRAGEIWKKWARGVERGEWARHPSDWHESWLHVVQTSWFSSGRRATRYGTAGTVVLDGSGITTTAAFHCALGEAVNGPGGYFGSSTGGLDDCLRSVRRENAAPFHLVWQDFASSREALGDEFTDFVMSLFREHGVTATPEEGAG